MADQKIILRIAKLKRLAAGSDGAESENAMREAMRLEAKYDVTVDVEDLNDFVRGEEEKQRLEQRWVHVCSYKERPWHDWRQFLLQQLAPLYECVPFPKEVATRELFFLWVGGEPQQLEYCVSHFDWLCYRVETVAEECDWDELTRSEKRGVRWGAMDQLLKKMTKWGPPQAQQAETEVTDEAAGALEGDVNPYALVPKRGLVRVGGPGDVGPRPDPIDAEPPPMWAYRRGYRAAVVEEPQPPMILLQPTQRLPGLDGATKSILVAMGYATVAQLVRARPKELIAQHGIGRKRLKRIRIALERHGLQLMADWGRGSEAPRAKPASSHSEDASPEAEPGPAPSADPEPKEATSLGDRGREMLERARRGYRDSRLRGRGRRRR